MKILPKVNFAFMVLAIKISEEELKDWQNILNKFLSGDKKRWYISQKVGRLGLPKSILYYIASQLRHRLGIRS